MIRSGGHQRVGPLRPARSIHVGLHDHVAEHQRVGQLPHLAEHDQHQDVAEPARGLLDPRRPAPGALGPFAALSAPLRVPGTDVTSRDV